jgi:uncharacterized protein (DUF362 family)
VGRLKVRVVSRMSASGSNGKPTKTSADEAQRRDEARTESSAGQAPQGDSSAPAANASAAAEAARRSRRAFLRQAGAIAGITAGASWAALAPAGWPLSLSDPDGERGKPRDEARRLPQNGYVVAPPKTVAELGIARGDRLEPLVRAAIDAIGGMAHYVKPGDVVVIKPNVAFERSAPLGATTHPDVVAALVKLAREAGADEVRVVDNPIESPESCFARSGIRAAALQAGARVYLPAPGDFELVEVPGATWIARWPFFWRPFADATKVIGVAPVKDHNLCSASMTTKNWYGLLGGRRNQFHQDIHGIISDLALMMRPTFVLLDGSRVLFRSGPTGGSLADVRPGQTMVASCDTLAIDAFGWDDLLRRKGQALPDYFRRAHERKLGNPRWSDLRGKEVQIG